MITIYYNHGGHGQNLNISSIYFEVTQIIVMVDKIIKE